MQPQIEKIQIEWFLLRYLYFRMKGNKAFTQIIPRVHPQLIWYEDSLPSYISTEILSKNFKLTDVTTSICLAINMRKEIQLKYISYILEKPFQKYIKYMNHDFWYSHFWEYQVVLDKGLEKGEWKERPTSFSQVLTHSSRIIQKGFFLEFVEFILSGGKMFQDERSKI